MWLYPMLSVGLVVVAFGYLTVRAFLLGMKAKPSSNTRRLSFALGWVCVVFTALGIQAFAQQAVLKGWLPQEAMDWMFTWGTSILATISLSVAGLCVWLLSRVLVRVYRHERLVSVLIDSPLVDVKASELKLTAREVEILEAMAQGNLSDDEIASAFVISPATAATHVRNILRKADLHNRRDLVLLYAAGRAADTDDPPAEAAPTR